MLVSGWSRVGDVGKGTIPRAYSWRFVLGYILSRAYRLSRCLGRQALSVVCCADLAVSCIFTSGWRISRYRCERDYRGVIYTRGTRCNHLGLATYLKRPFISYSTYRIRKGL